MTTSQGRRQGLAELMARSEVRTLTEFVLLARGGTTTLRASLAGWDEDAQS